MFIKYNQNDIEQSHNFGNCGTGLQYIQNVSLPLSSTYSDHKYVRHFQAEDHAWPLNDMSACDQK